MTALDGRVRVRQHDRTITFQVEGWGRMTHGLPVRRFAEQAVASGATALRVDLRRCAHMDSTFLGSLLCLKRLADSKLHGDFALVSPSPPCRQLVHQTGLDTLFRTLDEDEPAAAAWTELVGEIDDPDAFKHNAVQAHEELAAIPGPAGDVFRDVLRCLAEEAPPKSTR